MTSNTATLKVRASQNGRRRYSASAEIVYSQARDTTLENHSNSMVHQKGPGSTHRHTDSRISRLQRPPRHPLSKTPDPWLSPTDWNQPGAHHPSLHSDDLRTSLRPGRSNSFLSTSGKPDRHTQDSVEQVIADGNPYSPHRSWPGPASPPCLPATYSHVPDGSGPSQFAPLRLSQQRSRRSAPLGPTSRPQRLLHFTCIAENLSHSSLTSKLMNVPSPRVHQTLLARIRHSVVVITRVLGTWLSTDTSAVLSCRRILTIPWIGTPPSRSSTTLTT
ncbi:hypothetical protein BDP55DRAFT_261573 [Colletotrichum godetiae]|uniref:Uncharacterized protein n=1 Tax=Colletotrichum godetiae TaxID=1209918 RepID=A0AAJ0F141_9PEZI|nr:uncharacterized protein BDP55DRAFT_261573 [Colletotrichum godetiae]KAK1691331.1 hypothetical protein BDP55DRAFT_261573 [Colletotrichum godetiae]